MIGHQYAAFEVSCTLIVIWHVLIIFPVNLSRVYESAAYESDYDNLPLLCT